MVSWCTANLSQDGHQDALDTRGWEAGAYILVWTNDKGAPEGAPLTWIKLPD